MTGFGKAQIVFKGKLYTAEIRSLNSKQLDLNLRIPSSCRHKEPELRNEIAKEAERGKIDFSIYIESTGESTAIINKPLAKNYHRELKALAVSLNEKNASLLDLVMRMPDVMKPEREELSEKEWKHVHSCALKALQAFSKFREAEGRSLRNDLEKRIGLISHLLASVEAVDKKRLPAIRLKLMTAVEELRTNVDMNRFEQELIFYMEKLDITEEKVRLRTHCGYFLETLNERSPGRKLNFIAQEIGREINTIGSKASDADMQKRVVEMKDELEKIKEQLNNVL